MILLPSACHLHPEGMRTASSLGFRANALTFINPPAVVAIISGLTQMWASTGKTEGAALQFRGGGGA